MYFDRFDICAAYYWFACDYQSGQFSALYAKLRQLDSIGFRISPLSRSIEDESENAREIYSNLKGAQN